MQLYSPLSTACWHPPTQMCSHFIITFAFRRRRKKIPKPSKQTQHFSVTLLTIAWHFAADCHFRAVCQSISQYEPCAVIRQNQALSPNG
jgi:hypothetical protein